MAARKKTPGSAPIKEAVHWLGYALGDLATAASNRKDSSVPNRNAAYMAQQATEKAIRAVILLENEPFEMVHDIDVLAGQAPTDFPMPVSSEDLAWLSELETAARYPDDFDVITVDDTDRAIDISRSIIDATRAHFASRGVTDEDLTPA
jgi:HEPN domain-containing protein